MLSPLPGGGGGGGATLKGKKSFESKVAHFFLCVFLITQVGMLHQSTGSSEWMLGVLKPVTTGSLNVSVRFVSGQSSTFNVKSSMTVGAVKALVAADAILAPLESSPSAAALGLMYLGKVLEDDKTRAQPALTRLFPLCGQTHLSV